MDQINVKITRSHNMKYTMWTSVYLNTDLCASCFLIYYSDLLKRADDLKRLTWEVAKKSLSDRAWVVCLSRLKDISYDTKVYRLLESWRMVNCSAY